MTDYRRLSIIIPVYNEAETIAEIIDRVNAVDISPLEREIVVVNDGSTDDTATVLETINGITVVTHDENSGKGAAVKTGIARASGQILLIQDGDLEYDPKNYPALLAPILKHQSEFVIGSRFIDNGPRFFTANGDPFVSHYIGNLMIIWLTNCLYRQRLTDYEGCYKAFTRQVADTVSVAANGFEFDNELMCKSMRRGIRLHEVSIDYSPRLYSDGKKIRWTDGLVMLWTIIKWRFKSF